MSDPISVAGTVAGLVSLALQLSQVSLQYVASVKNSSKAWSSYIRELSALTSALIRLQTASEAQECGSVLASLGLNVDMLHRYHGLFSSALLADNL